MTIVKTKTTVLPGKEIELHRRQRRCAFIGI